MFSERAPGVYSVATRFVDGTNAVIVGERGAVAVDVGYYPDEGTATADFIRSLGHTPNWVILTHGHSDHVLGGAAFKGAEVYAHAKTPPEMRRQLAVFAQRKALSEQDLLTQALWPTVTFADEMAIDLGDRSLHLFPTPGHSPDHISIYQSKDRVLCAGDTVVTGIVPAIGDGDSRTLENSLQKLLSYEAEVVIAGHGPPLVGAGVVREWLTWMIDYLSGIRTIVHKALAAGATLDEAADSVSFEHFVGSRLPADQHNMPRRHRDTALKIASEEAARLQAASLTLSNEIGSGG